MHDIAGIQRAFPSVSNLTSIGGISGQKDVFKADRKGEKVAVKIIKKTGSNDEELKREMAAVSLLQAGFVPEVYDYGSREILGQERFYVIEQFIEGETVRSVFDGQQQDVDFVLKLGSDLLKACVLFEEKNLVHRDIKPANLISDAAGNFWIIDFGIVRLLDMESRTATGRRFGRFTPGYGAPEQVRNMKGKINSRADLYSIGIVMDEGLRGHNFYHNGARSAIDIINRAESTDLPLLDNNECPNRDLARFIRTLAARYPTRRPQSAKEALSWFQSIIS